VEDQDETADIEKTGESDAQAEARALLQADLRNLKRRVIENGDNLTTAERRYLTAAAGGGLDLNFAPSYVDLATALGVSRKTIQRAKLRPGAPTPRPDGRHDVQAWRAFLLPDDIDPDEGTDDDEDGPSSVESARDLRLNLQNKKTELQIGLMARELVPTLEVRQWGAQMGAAVRKIVTQIHRAAPSLVGLPVAVAEERLKEIEDDILSQLHALPERLDQFTNERPG
jgi:hypothetical protein